MDPFWLYRYMFRNLDPAMDPGAMAADAVARMVTNGILAIKNWRSKWLI